MSKEKKNPNVNEHECQFMSSSTRSRSDQNQGKQTPPGQATAAVEATNQPHNAKKEALGPNTKRG